MSLFLARGRGNEFGYRTVHLLKHEVVGTGSYGSVCRAKLDQLLCAAKCLHPALTDLRDPGAQRFYERFHSECEILSRIRHPNIVQYLGTATDPDTRRPVLFMELLDSSLTQFLEESLAPLPYHLLINFAHDITMAMVFLHHNNIIHRDLSGNNVLLLAGVRAKVTDFGMSNLLQTDSRLTNTLTMCPGSHVYMPPEALENAPKYNERIDIFSMGVLLIQMMTRLFPNPTDRYRHVNYSTDDRRLLVAVTELERRREHIEMIATTHPLLPIALQCLKEKDIQRPSTDGLCQQIEAFKNTEAYQTSQQQIPERRHERREERRANVERQDSQDSLRQLNQELLGDLEDKEAMIQAQQRENQDLIERFQQKTRQLEEAEQALHEERRRRGGTPVPFHLPRPCQDRPPGLFTENPWNRQEELEEQNSRLRQRVCELEARERQLQETIEQTASPDEQYSAVLYTPSYIKNEKKEWNAVLALCPKSLTSITTDLRKLVSETFEAPFTSSSVGVTFDHGNTLTVGVPDDASTRDHQIQFNVSPPTIERSEVDFLDSDSELIREADEINPPRIILTIRPSPHANSILKCNLLLNGVHMKRTLILSTPTLIKPRNLLPRDTLRHQQPTVHVTPAVTSLMLDPEQSLELQSMQRCYTGYVSVTASAVNEQLYTDSDRDHPVLDEEINLARIMNLCGSEIPQRWRALGTQLDIPRGDLNAIEPRAAQDIVTGVQDMFVRWQEVDINPTWRKLLKALRTPHVREPVLAYNIQKQLTTNYKP